MNDLSVMREILPQITDVDALQKTMLAMPQVGCNVIHRFGPGIYIREVFIPAGTFAIGHYQKYEHMNVFLKGKVLMVNDGRAEELIAPMSFVGQPGRKVGYIVEDMYWQNIYATDERDIQKLESMFFDKSADFEECQSQKLLIEHTIKEIDRADYAQILIEIGITQDQIDEEVFADNLIALPSDSYKFMLADSPIHGTGVFATAEIGEGEIIAPARLGKKRTPLGRYTNHSAIPNALMVSHPSGDMYLVASRSIDGMQGGAPGEEITIDYRQALAEGLLCQQ